ncbi:MAG: Mu-like prophage major head subunit gpT family protein, partial [Nitrososphaera sp.]|nr:Mu-like prophage major head subunit gpT family protein [Nitrososphaera sp.]
SKDSYERWSQIGDLAEFSQFNGSVTYQDIAQGYDVTAEHLAFSNGLQVTRQLYDDDRHGVWERQAPGLADSWQRTRQTEGMRMFNLAFSVDTKYYNNTEAVALCSDSHTTTAAGISTASGFDNLSTGALSAVNVGTLRTQMRGFRGDVANRISVVPSLLLVPVDLMDRADEITKSSMQPDSANNNYNPQQRFKAVDSEYLTDTNNWFNNGPTVELNEAA